MIKQRFKIEDYWEVIVYYDVDYNLFDDVVWEMKMSDMPDKSLKEIWKTLKHDEAKAVTCNNIQNHISIVIFNPHQSDEDYINSIVHEAEHVKQAMLKAYRIEDAGEPPAYAVGYIVMRMYEVFKNILKN